MSTFSIPALETALQTRLPATLDFLRELVGINSYSCHRAGVEENAARIIAQFDKFGFKASRVPCRDEGTGDHLFLDSGGDGPVIACISHLDTVFTAEEEAANDFHWREEPAEGRIYGPGTMDIKGGTAMIWLLLDAMAETMPELFRSIRWILAWNAAEERLTPCFGEACRAIFPDDTRAALVFEADSGKPGAEPPFCILESRKGWAKYRVEVLGRGAHAGSVHEAGANAIHQLARTIDRLQNLTDYDRDVSVNVGVLSGGSVVNRVPHQAGAELEMRTYDPDRFEEYKQKIEAFSGPGEITAASDGFACEVKVSLLREAPPWPRNPGTDGLVAQWKAAAAEYGVGLNATRRGGISDGNFLCDRFPTLDGVGIRGGNAHASERSADGTKVPEYVDVTSFVPKTLINLLAIRNIVAG
ncbi:MAG TPA: M20/M25/M40 family metallo-hydrolase [Chthoniobacteraceae bacterium]|nr:M20/M25/M40 family metallo-hydrolase [Chthoniobacteraceae bacterium]